MVGIPDMQSINSITSNFVQTLYIIVLVLLGVFILSIIVYRLTFKCQVRLRYLTGTHDKVKNACGKLVVDKSDGITKLIVMHKLFKTFSMPAPPSEAVSLSFRGKDVYDIEVPTNGSPRYLIRDHKSSAYRAYDSNDKIFLLNEDEKRKMRKSKNVYDIIGQAIPYIFMLIVFIGLIAFWGDIVEPFNKAGETNLAIMQENAKITSMLKEIIAKEQLLTGEVEVLSPPVNSSLPPE